MVALALLALYLVTLNRQYAFDALDYAWSAKSGEALYHPHHLLYNAFAHLLHRALPRADVLTLLAATNAVVSAIGAFLLHRICTALGARQTVADLVALGYGLAAGIWYMATSVECYPIALAAQLGALALVVTAKRPSAARAIGAGALAALGVLFHQTGVFFVLPLAWLV
jgi:hypothetical protein